MSQFSYIQNNMTAGQVSPRIYRRSDLSRYKNGLKTLTNMTILPQGGVKSRPGTIYVSGVKDHSKTVRLERFQFSSTDSYILEFGDGYLRIYKDGGQVLESDKTITAITKADPGVVTSTSHNLLDGDQIYITEVGGMTEVNNSTQYYIVANKTSNTFELTDQDGNNVDTSAFTTYTTGGVINRIYTLATDYTESDLFELQFAQSADKMYITHQDYAPRELTRSADTSWTITALMKDGDATSATLQFVDGPYLTENSTATTLTPSGTSGSVTVTASATTGINDDTGFQTTDVGRLIRFKDAGGTWHYLEITARSSTTVVTATIKDTTLSATTASASWRLGAWSETTGFPSATAFYQGRHAYAGSVDQPDTIWLSKTDDFTNFTPGTDADDPISATLATQEVNAIIWLSSFEDLRIGTLGSEHILRSADNGSALSPTNVEATQGTSYGSKLRVRPVQVGPATIFPQRTGKKLRQLGYSFEQDGYAATDLTIINEDITKDGVTQLAYQSEPDGVIWAVRTDGVLVGLTFLPDQDVVGWHTHELGGTSTVVESVAVVPVSSQDEVWVSVKRTINGSTRRYIERFSAEFIRMDLEDAVFCDSAIEYAENTPAATLTPAATTGTGIVLTAGSSVFTSADVGKIIKGNGGIAEIAQYSSGTSVIVDITTDFTNTNAISSGSWTLSTDTITGLKHLEGETVAVLTDGGTHTQEVVSSGSITLDYQATDIQIGLPYTQTLETLDIDFGSGTGTAYSTKGRIHKVILQLYESMGGKIGYDTNSLKSIVYRSGSNTSGVGVGKFSGQVEEKSRTGWKDTNKVVIQQQDPLPLTITGLTITGQVTDAT